MSGFRLAEQSFIVNVGLRGLIVFGVIAYAVGEGFWPDSVASIVLLTEIVGVCVILAAYHLSGIRAMEARTQLRSDQMVETLVQLDARIAKANERRYL